MNWCENELGFRIDGVYRGLTRYVWVEVQHKTFPGTSFGGMKVGGRRLWSRNHGAQHWQGELVEQTG